MTRIRDLRVSKGFTQNALATLLECNQTAVGKYERGELEPNIDTLCKLSNIFNCSVDYLIGNSDDFGNVNVIENGAVLTKDEQTLLSCFQKLGPFEREAILIQIKALAGQNQTIKK